MQLFPKRQIETRRQVLIAPTGPYQEPQPSSPIVYHDGPILIKRQLILNKGQQLFTTVNINKNNYDSEK